MLQSTFSSLSGGSRNHERKLFVDEINVMKRVSDGNNPHVLKMLGCITTTNPMMLILQFVPHGNLKDYLRAMKAADDVRNLYIYITIRLMPYLQLQHAMHAHMYKAPPCLVKTYMYNQCMYVGWRSQNHWC